MKYRALACEAAEWHALRQSSVARMSLQEEIIIPDYDAPAAQPAPAQQPPAAGPGATIFDAPVAGVPPGGAAQVATGNQSR